MLLSGAARRSSHRPNTVKIAIRQTTAQSAVTEYDYTEILHTFKVQSTGLRVIVTVLLHWNSSLWKDLVMVPPRRVGHINLFVLKRHGVILVRFIYDDLS